MSAWLWAAAWVVAEIWVDVDAGGPASVVADLLHAPMAATAANATTPIATVLVLFTPLPVTRIPFVVEIASQNSLPQTGAGLLVVL
jgi:hypothetical protein